MVQDTLKDGAMGTERFAKIPTKDVPYIIGKLDMKRFVQTQLDTNFFDLLRLWPRSQIACRGI